MYHKVLKFNNFFLVSLKKTLLIKFFKLMSNVLIDNFKNGKNFYVFSKYNFFSLFWKLNLGKLFFKYKDKKLFTKLINFFLFTNKVGVILTLDFNFFTFMRVIEKLNLTKIGFLNNPVYGIYYNYYITLPYINFTIQYSVYHYLTKLYIIWLNTKQRQHHQYYLFKQVNLSKRLKPIT